MDKKEKTGVLNVRDLVNVGLFSVLIFIATFLSGMIGFIPVLMPVSYTHLTLPTTPYV